MNLQGTGGMVNPQRVGGMLIVTSDAMVDRVRYRYCRSKKKRIKKKWAKDPRNYRNVPKTDVIVRFDTIVCHPAILDSIKRLMERTNGGHHDTLRH